MTPNCAGHLEMHTDICTACQRFAPGGRHAPAIQLQAKGPAMCLDYVITPRELQKFERELPF